MNGLLHRWSWQRLVLLLAVVVASHLLTVWAAPRLIVHLFLQRAASQGLGTPNQAAFPAPVTARSRTIVMPSPDLLYSICKFDLSGGPVHITASPQLPGYWSVALYGANSDNFYVQNDQQAAGKPINLWLVHAHGGTTQPKAPEGSTVVQSPSRQGVLLMRVLTGNYAAEKTFLEPARRTLVCAAASGPAS